MVHLFLASAAVFCQTVPLTPALSSSQGAQTSVTCAKQTLTKDFLAEGCTVADFNHDAHRDVCVGRFIWFGPSFEQRVAYTPERENAEGLAKTPYRADTGYSDYFLQFAHDFTADGFADILVYGPPGTAASVFVNPGASWEHTAKESDWKRVDIFDVADGESPDMKDVTGDGTPELLCHTNGQFGFVEIDRSSPLAKARFHAISAKSAEGDAAIQRYTHGYGAGDINNDGRADILTSKGWYEQPIDRASLAPWSFHAADFGEGGAQMYAMDVNDDGRTDVITSIKAHSYGLSWFEQRADGSFLERVILSRTAADNAGDNTVDNGSGAGFSQIHALSLADMNGDGVLDIVTGKRRWAHGPMGDDEPMAPPMLCWFELVRAAPTTGERAVHYVKHDIDADSGVGTQVWTGLLNNDTKPDIVVGNKHGAFVFTQR